VTFFQTPHKRYNPLTGEWVLVSPHRLQRPWQGKVESRTPENRPVYDPQCYLCPGNQRAGGKQNPAYTENFIFQNDFAALLPESGSQDFNEAGILVAHSEKGICRVLCYSPRHDLTMAEMEEDNIHRVIGLWREQYQELGDNKDISYVQIFENKGAIMGCSNPHPHGQIWATQTIPLEPEKELIHQKKHYEEHSCQCLLCQYLQAELHLKDRLVFENDAWVVLVPFWAKWPFETMVLPKRHLAHLGQMTEIENKGLANALKVLTTQYDNLFEVSFPYTMGFHNQPVDGKEYPFWHLHLHFYPPLLRSATVQKFMVGFEMLATPQRDITAESAAERIRTMPLVHYRKQG